MECVGVPALGRLRRGWAGPRRFVGNGWRDRRDELGCGKRIGLVGDWWSGGWTWRGGLGRGGGGKSLTSKGLSYSGGLRSGRWRSGGGSWIRGRGGLWSLTPTGLKTGHYTLNKFGARRRQGSVP